MALWVCRQCGCKFAVGLAMCPQCTGTDVKEDSEVAKTTLSGPSDAAADAEAAEAEKSQAVDKPVDESKEAKSSAGTSSSKRTSSQKTEASKAETSKPKSAQTTESHSKKDQTGSSTAHSTDTDQAD